MSVSQLQPATTSQVQRSSKEGEDKEADFLALRLLNKRARVRLSPNALKLGSLPGRGTLFATANSLGCFAAVTNGLADENNLIVSSLSELRSAFASTALDGEIPYDAQRVISLPTTPNALTFAFNNSRLLVGLTDGSIVVYDVQILLSERPNPVEPLYIFSSPTSTAVRALAPNPADLANLVAVLYEASGNADSLSVQLLDVQKLEISGGWKSGSTPKTIPTSLSWSPKGKQLAIGLQSGEVVTFSPADTSKVKSLVPSPPSLQSFSAISTTWLSNTDFHCIYASPGSLTPESEQAHYILSLDSKANTATDVKLINPYLPYPGLRGPGAFTTVLRNWDPAKFLLFIGDSTSSDIGLIGCTTDASGQEVWTNFSLEETSTPTVPLDKDMNDTVLLGLDLDLTGTETYNHKTASGEDAVLPPPPVMYAYASDGTIVGWNLLNLLGSAYPNMVKPVAPIAQDSTSMTLEFMTDAQVVTSLPIQAPLFGNAPTPTFGQASTTPPFGQSAFSLPPSQTGFGQSAPFGGASPTSSSPFGSQAPGGSGAFASAGPSSFGQSSFGASSLVPPMTKTNSTSPALASPMTISMSNSEEPMSAVFESNSGFGSLSLGGGDQSTEIEKKPSSSGVFGSFASPSTNETKPGTGFGSTNAFGGSSSLVKPASGFGAFANQGTSAFGSTTFGSTSPPAPEDVNKPAPSPAFGSSGFTAASSPAFGSSGFTAASSPAFGQSGFGSKPAFGQSTFGQPAFGQSGLGSTTTKPPFGQPSPSGVSTGAFSAFAQSGTSTFGSALTQVSGFDKKESSSAIAEASKTPPGETTPAATDETLAIPSTPKPVSAFGSSAAPSTSNVFGSTPNPSTTPSSSPFKSSILAPASGAFAGLTASPVGFGKLESGFGAFGNATSTSSPFFNPPKTPTTSAFSGPVSAFSASPSATPAPSKPTSGSSSALGAVAKPSFGTPSVLGAPTTVFGKSTLSSPTTPIKPVEPPTSGGFGAFAGSGGFGAFAGGSKSFGDLLRKETDAKELPKEPPKAPISVFSRPSPMPLRQPSAASYSRTASTRATESEEGDDHGDGRDVAEDEDETVSFLSDTFSEDEDEDEDESGPEEGSEDDDDDDDDDDESDDNSQSSQPPNSTTPGIRLTSSSPPATSSSAQITTGDAEDATTPSGPPEKQSAVASPVPVNASPSSTSFTLGLGRPSTRPARSSPLANAPISGDDEDEEEGDATVKTKTSKLPEGASMNLPSTVSAQMPSSSLSPKPEESAEKSKSRPKTPPLLSTFTPIIPKPSPFTLAPLTRPSSEPTAKLGNIFDINLPTPSHAAKFDSVLSPPLALPNVFGKPVASSSQSPFSPPPGGFFGKKETPSPPGSFGQDPAPAATPLSPGGLLGKTTANAGPKTPAQAAPVFGTKLPSSQIPTTAGSFGKAPAQPTPGPSASALQPLEEGMQRECMNLFRALAEELEGLKGLASQAREKREENFKPLNISRTKADLTDPKKFGVGDAVEFGRIMRSVERDILELKDVRAAHVKTVGELEGAMLKATMRKEEIVRFSKAKKDAQFEKMLNSRTLGPEHLETQSQLRRSIRVIRDRILKLEDHLQTSKKRLNEMKLGKPGIRPPSLDTINRTYRNIDSAIAQQAEEVARLAARMSKLNLKHETSTSRADSRDKRLPLDLRSSPSRRPLTVTPSVAVTTAAALNAERSARKLKGALLKIRKEPLLNTQAVDAPVLQTTFNGPNKPPSSVSPVNALKIDAPAWTLNIPSNGALPETPKWSLPPFQIQESPGSPSPSPSHGGSLRQRGTGPTTKMHSKPIALKKSPGIVASTGVTSPPAGFSWGPLPGVTPMNSLSSDVRKKEAGSSTTGALGLSASWVAEGFTTPQ